MKSIEDRAMAYSVCQIADEITERRIREAYIKGATEQMQIDTKEFMAESLEMLKAERERVKKEMIDKACEWIGNYLMEIGYPDDWMRDSKVQSSGEQRFRKAMEG